MRFTASCQRCARSLARCHGARLTWLRASAEMVCTPPPLTILTYLVAVCDCLVLGRDKKKRLAHAPASLLPHRFIICTTCSSDPQPQRTTPESALPSVAAPPRPFSPSPSTTFNPDSGTLLVNIQDRQGRPSSAQPTERLTSSSHTCRLCLVYEFDPTTQSSSISTCCCPASRPCRRRVSSPASRQP